MAKTLIPRLRDDWGSPWECENGDVSARFEV
jgi:hypothetical protein